MNFKKFLKEKVNIELGTILLPAGISLVGLIIILFLVPKTVKTFIFLSIFYLPMLLLLVYVFVIYHSFLEYKAIINNIKAQITSEYEAVVLKKEIEVLGIPSGRYKAMIDEKDRIFLKIFDSNGIKIYGPKIIEPELFFEYFC